TSPSALATAPTSVCASGESGSAVTARSARRRASSTLPSSSRCHPSSIPSSLACAILLLLEKAFAKVARTMPMTSQTRKACRRVAAAVTALLVLGGCPKRFDPRAETVRSSPDAEADHEYHEAKARLDIGDAREAEQRFAEFLKKHPNDPLAPSA